MKVINDLYDYGLKIVQDTDYFKFSLDSILLAEFIDEVDKSNKIIDFCTGNAVIPLILSTKYDNNVIGFELQKEIYLLALESTNINKLNDKITIINDDISNVKNYFPGNMFDIVIANPPYFKVNSNSIINDNIVKSIARHEVNLNLEILFNAVSSAIKNKGSFYLVHLPERLQEILIVAEKFNFRAKKIQLIYTNETKNAKILLIKFLKNGNNDVKILPAVFINNYNSYKNIFKR